MTRKCVQMWRVIRKPVAILLLGFLGISALASTAYAQYCSASASYCDEYIGRVTVSNIDNPTGCSYYADYTASVAPAQMDVAVGYQINVYNGGYYYSGDIAHVWVDWNSNYSFLDAGEYTTMATIVSGGHWRGTITPPVGTPSGPKRMRVRMSYYVSPPGNPCGTESFGEVEDYTIQVNACIPPTIIAPPSFSIGNTPGQCGASASQVFLGAPEVTSDEECCEGPTVVGNDAPSYFPAGVTTTVTWTVMDACGLKASATQNVTVVDTEPPSLWVIVWPQFLAPPNGQMRNINAFVNATDNCANIDWVLDGVYSNQPDEGSFAGDQPGDISAVIGSKTTSFALRAENSPGRGSRLYTIRYRATDVGGRTVYSMKNVAVQFGGGGLIFSDDSNIPTSLGLSQNYPNPFSGSTSFTFRLPEDAHASVRVYDMLGREVAVVAEGEFVAGSHSVEFNGSDLQDGVYLYKLITNDGVVTKKMVMAR